MSIVQFLRILLMRRLIIFVVLIASVLAGIAILRMIPKQYEATSRVLLQIIRPDPVTGEVISSSFARAYTKTQIELIKDYRVAGRAVDKLGWADSAQLAEQYAQSGSDQPFRRWLASMIVNGTEARLIDASNILEIVYTGQSADGAARVANALREAYEEQTVLFKRQDAQKNARWYSEQSTALRAQLVTAEKRKADFERANGIILQDDSTDADSSRLQSMATTSTMPPMISAGPMMAAQGPGPMQMQLAQIDAAIATASRTLGPNHPDFISLQRQRQVVATAAAQEQAAAAANARAASGGVAAGPSAEAMFNAQREKVLSQRGNLAEAKQLLGDVTLLRTQLAEMQLKLAKAEQEAQSVDAGLTLLGSATPPDQISFPRTFPILAGSVALGLSLGILLALLFELLNRRVRSPDDIRFDDVPMIGVIQGRLQRDEPRRLTRILRLVAPSGTFGAAT